MPLGRARLGMARPNGQVSWASDLACRSPSPRCSPWPRPPTRPSNACSHVPSHIKPRVLPTAVAGGRPSAAAGLACGGRPGQQCQRHGAAAAAAQDAGQVNLLQESAAALPARPLGLPANSHTHVPVNHLTGHPATPGQSPTQAADPATRRPRQPNPGSPCPRPAPPSGPRPPPPPPPLAPSPARPPPP
jgi:hypothetical protein